MTRLAFCSAVELLSWKIQIMWIELLREMEFKLIKQILVDAHTILLCEVANFKIPRICEKLMEYENVRVAIIYDSFTCIYTSLNNT